MPRFDDSAQKFLLHLARGTIEDALRGRGLPQASSVSPALLEPRGVFVSLKKAARLRGCIGVILSSKPLYRTVQECALSAAFQDPRFDPVTADELPHLHLEISVLAPPTVTSPEMIEVGRHGLIVSMGSRRGLLLPQVALEWKWDRERFLEETCLKAGLPPHAWKHGAKVEAFTAQVFAEPISPADADSPAY